MKKTIGLIIAVLMIVGFAGCEYNDIKKDEMVKFAVETIAMGIGYEARNDFVWTDEVDSYYEGIMAGSLNIIAAQKAQKYLFANTHPLIANRFIKLGTMVGFNLDEAGAIIGVDSVDIALLQTAAEGFRIGLYLDEAPK